MPSGTKQEEITTRINGSLIYDKSDISEDRTTG